MAEGTVMTLDPNARGTVYLVHFSGLTSQNRQHYLGWSADVGRRFAQHASGRGAQETRKAIAEGLKIMLAQTWKGTPDLERRIKLWSRCGAKGFAGLCPYCDRGTELPEALARELGPPTYTVRWGAPAGAGATAGEGRPPISCENDSSRVAARAKIQGPRPEAREDSSGVDAGRPGLRSPRDRL
jgi:predicted GIY-YIG superfamily endonuclease